MFNYEKLLAILEKRGVSQAELARAVYVTPVMIFGIVHGAKQPSLSLVVRMAKFLDCTIDELVCKG